MDNDFVLHALARRVRHWAALLLYLLPATVIAQAISDIRIIMPRDFGYTIGDTLRQEMLLELNDPFRLDSTTLPATGRLNRWLELSQAVSSVEYEAQIAMYRIIVDYQIFNAPEQMASVTIPQLEFMIVSGETQIPVFIPEWTFSIVPITDLSARQSLQLRPDRRPQPISVNGRRMRLILSTLLLTGLLTYFAYRRFWSPWLDRDHYPFSHALRELRRLRKSHPAPERYRSGLLAIHKAINTTARQVVFAGNLEEFLTANSKYAPLRAELSSFYAQSQDVFFNDLEVPQPDISFRQLIALCRHCRVLEASAD